MSYIGNEPTSVAFLTDTFSGNGSTTAFTMSAAPATTTSILVAVTGVLQDPSTYSVVGTTLTFSAAPPSGTGNISVRYLGIPASGVTTTAYRTITEFTATAGQTTFTPPSYTPGYINVYRNGALLSTTDYTATNGTTVVLGSAASASDLVTIESFYVSSVLNALPQTGGTLSGSLVVNGATGQNPLIVQNNTTEAMRVDSSGNVGIGTNSPQSDAGYKTLTMNGSSGGQVSFRVNNVNVGSIFSSSGFLNLATTTSVGMTFTTNAAERMRIDTSGNLLVGTTTSPSGTGQINCPKGVSGTPAFSAYAGSATTLANPGWVKVLFNTEEYDTNNNYDTTNSRFTPTVAGYYQVSATASVVNNAQSSLAVYKNGTNYKRGNSIVANSSGGSTLSALVYCNGSTDYLEIFAYNNGTANTTYTGIELTWFQAVLVRGA